MECHCKDHLPGEWHSHEECDCHRHPYPTYMFVITKVVADHQASGVVYISKQFMELLELAEGDPVEMLTSPSCILQAKAHPNSWIDTRMISVDQDTMDRLGLTMFAQVKLRKAVCCSCRSLTLQVPEGVSLGRVHLRSLIEKRHGTVLHNLTTLHVTTESGEDIHLPIVAVEPQEVSRLVSSTAIKFLDAQGREYVSKNDTSFSDVGGLAEAIKKVREVVQLPLKHPEIFRHLGIDPPRGVLLHGPSGTGKTLIARAVASETGCYFKSIIGTEIMDKYYGESEAKLRAAFEEAQQNRPAIIFIDEIDALAPRRDATEGEVERRVTAQLLALMDGLKDRGSVIVLAATNLPNTLDTALRRPGRFDREILIGVPDRDGRREILAIHTRDMPLGQVDLDEIAEKTHGFVGADLKALCSEASFRALRRVLPGLEDTDQTLSQDFLDAVKVEQEDFDSALADMRPASGRIFDVDLTDCGWDHVAGYENEKTFLKDLVIWPLKHDRFLSTIGVKKVTGLLITGPSGVGKTLMARSLAKESGLNVIELTGTELLSKYMGESEKNIREIFKQARQMAPTLVVLDAIDALNASGWSDSKVLERIANQLAKEMSAAVAGKPVVVVATALSSQQVPAVLRATGKFSHELRLKPPTDSDRMEMLKMWLNTPKIKFSGDLEAARRASEGFTGGEIKDICNRALLDAARKVIETHNAAPEVIHVSVDNVLKMMDLWRLNERRDSLSD